MRELAIRSIPPLFFAFIAALVWPGPLGAQTPGAAVSRDSRIAIIGAGPAGLTAAWDLTHGGFEHVTVFEREAAVGGRVRSIELDGHIFEDGAEFTFDSYKTVFELAEAVGYASAPMPIRKRIVSGGRSQPERAYFAAQPVRTALQRRRMDTLIERYTPEEDAGYETAAPELLVSFDRFIADHGVEIYGRKIAMVLTSLGLGYPSETPAVYYMRMLRWFDVRLLSPFDASVNRFNTQANGYFPEGFQGLWRRVAEGMDVRLNSEVTSVVRAPGGEGGGIQITAGGVTESFDHLIVATGLPAARRFMDLRPDEAALLAQVKTYSYCATVLRSTGLDPWHAEAFAEAVHDKAGAPVLMLFRPGEPDLYYAYQLAPEGMSDAQVNARLVADLEASGHAAGAVERFTRWGYFPHVEPAAAAAGFFVDMDRLQGAHHTYYVGGGLTFDSVEDNARHARGIVRRHLLAVD